MEKKIVQLEIGKGLTVIIAIVVVAIIAAMVLQGGYFKGALVTDKQEVIVTNDAALKTMEKELARGVVANDVVDHYIKNTGKYFSVDQVNILADEIEAGRLAKDKTKDIVADFALDVLAIEAKYILADDAKSIETADALKEAVVIIEDVKFIETTDTLKEATVITEDAKSL